MKHVTLDFLNVTMMTTSMETVMRLTLAMPASM